MRMAAVRRAGRENRDELGKDIFMVNEN